MNFDFNRVLFIGFGGITGRYYARLLQNYTGTLYVYDRALAADKHKQERALADLPGVQPVKQADFDSGKILGQVDALTLSPGVPLSSNIFQTARALGKVIFSELEFTSHLLSARPILAITGTDGKSTTTALASHLLTQSGLKATACGNLGVPLSRLCLEQDPGDLSHWLVIEVSSYQLELSRNFHPRIALLLNLAPDHLNRYNSLQHYYRSKYNILQNMNAGDLFIINQNLLPGNEKVFGESHPLLTDFKDKNIPRVTIDTLNLSSENFSVRGDAIFHQKQQLCRVDTLAIQGSHNMANILFALEACQHALPPGQAVTGKALQSFRGLEHRFEIIQHPGPNHFINDSKASTIQATQKALENVEPGVFIFLGGQSKGEDYQNLAGALAHKQACLFLFGENAPELEQIFRGAGLRVISRSLDLEQAMLEAKNYQQESQLAAATYLLAPAATSWDQYPNFEERGRHFKELVSRLF